MIVKIKKYISKFPKYKIFYVPNYKNIAEKVIINKLSSTHCIKIAKLNQTFTSALIDENEDDIYT